MVIFKVLARREIISKSDRVHASRDLRSIIEKKGDPAKHKGL
uniref:Uncharacterized protein n=1 Tax=Nelumbo nucifera TaxID=4432 RepID=A0A822YEY5_NELNU|nr:TPA_asm: hypothetical protein HUJ06_009564 [Nelumbo nucifera]